MRWHQSWKQIRLFQMQSLQIPITLKITVGAMMSFLISVFFCKLEFAARACAYSGVLTAVSLISSPSYAWKRQDTRETLEDFNVQLLCGIPVL